MTCPVRTLIALTVLTALAAAGCTSTSGQGSYSNSIGRSGTPSPTATPATPTVDEVSFTDCTNVIEPQLTGQAGATRDLRFGCGRLSVPLDYTKPDGTHITLFLLRVRLSGQQHRIGSLVVNPGGPGGSGVDTAVGLGLVLSVDLLRRFDIVGFDPRGVGLSNPLKCIPAALKDQATALDPDARTAAEYQAQVAVARSAATDCTRKYGSSLSHYNTEETARDMDLIRQAVGDPELTYLGFSYGTRIGSVYATLFPKRVRAMVLDGAVDPVAGEVASAETQAKGFENAYSQFAAACAARPSCPLGRDPRAFLTALITSARAAPIRSSKHGETRRATAGYVLLAAISALYQQSEWSDLETALADAKRGDAIGVFRLADEYSQRDDKGSYTNLLDANITINCTDSSERISDGQIHQSLSAWRTRYPLFGTSLALGLLGCAEWTAPQHPIPAVRSAGSAPILVVGTRNDPATPYASAQVLTRQLGSARLLTWNGQGHTAYPKTTCVTTAVNTYLVTRQLPAVGKVCPR